MTELLIIIGTITEDLTWCQWEPFEVLSVRCTKHGIIRRWISKINSYSFALSIVFYLNFGAINRSGSVNFPANGPYKYAMVSNGLWHGKPFPRYTFPGHSRWKLNIHKQACVFGRGHKRNRKWLIDFAHVLALMHIADVLLVHSNYICAMSWTVQNIRF